MIAKVICNLSLPGRAVMVGKKRNTGDRWLEPTTTFVVLYA